MTMGGNDVHDVAGIGVGPFNLSLAALLHPLGIKARFYEAKEEFQWHPGLLFPDSRLQVSYLKDLVTLADPTSSFSFLAFLSAHHRLYRFINADFPRVSRREFVQYFRWVCSALPSLEFGRRVDEVRLDADALEVRTSGGAIHARNLVLGTGLAPLVPRYARPFLGPAVFHASEFLTRGFDSAGRRVTLVGGGQTGSELMLHLLSGQSGRPRELHWVSRRSNLLPLDETAFTNELFTPAFCEYFFGLPAEARFSILDEHKLAANGISPALLQQLYQRLYQIEFVEQLGPGCAFHLGREMVNLRHEGGEFHLDIRDPSGLQGPCTIGTDVVILCTGWEYTFPEFLAPLRSRISWSPHGFDVRKDFSIEWDGPASTRIYVQNAARITHGLAEPNLSIMAWRSATIANSIMGRTVYDVSDPHPVFRWGQPPQGPAQQERTHPMRTVVTR